MAASERALAGTEGRRGDRGRAWRLVVAWARKLYVDGVTGLSGMVAYNLLLSVFPLALVALFVAGQVLQSGDFEQTVLEDLRRLFPSAAESTLVGALASLRNSSTSIGIFALVASVWIGSSFWGALDTAFCRIYHVRCRGWLEQKRFALAMLVVVILFMAATVAVPTLQGILVAGASDLPLGLSEVRGLVLALTLLAAAALLFTILCIIYWSVPNRLVPWRAVWPGAGMATVAIAVIDYTFSFYVTNVSIIAQFGTTFVFVMVVLIWFYAIAITLLAGAAVNAMRFEAHEGGEPRAHDGGEPLARDGGEPLVEAE